MRTPSVFESPGIPGYFPARSKNHEDEFPGTPAHCRKRPPAYRGKDATDPLNPPVLRGSESDWRENVPRCTGGLLALKNVRGGFAVRHGRDRSIPPLGYTGIPGDSSTFLHDRVGEGW